MNDPGHVICEGCGNEVDFDCCDCFRVCGKVVVEFGGKPWAAWFNEYVYGKPDRVLIRLVATLAYEHDLAATGEPQRATAFECGVALRDASEEVAHLHWPSEKSMTPLLAYDGGAPVITDLPLVVTATSASEAPNWSMVIVFARDRGSYTL